MYVNGTGRDYYEFFIQLNRCGTLGENTHHQDSRKNPTVRKTDERVRATVYTMTDRCLRERHTGTGTATKNNND